MRIAMTIFCTAAVFVPSVSRADESPADANKAALQELNEYIGSWKASGGPDKPRPGPKDPTWSEAITWSWRFKGDDAWLNLQVKDGKYITSGELRYQPKKKVYLFTAVDAKKQKLEFEGKLDPKGYLIFERSDKTTGETQQLTMNSAGDGARFVYRYATRPKGGTVFSKQYMVAGSKEGESLGGAAKKNECVVTGGLGTIAVSYMGETYYVCCTGCRDAFNEDPAKFVKEYKEKKKKN
jgi:YHS domain